MNDDHQSEGSLAGEHALTDIGQLVLLTVFLATWVTDSFVFHYSDFLSGYVSLYVRLPAGLAMLVFSALLALPAHQAVFGKNRRSSGLITHGVFALVRHPMYGGSWLFTIGLVIGTLSAASALVSVVFLVFSYRVAHHEEALLSQKYGLSYRTYAARVPMLIPVKLMRRGGKG